MKKVASAVWRFIKRETVLCIAVLLAIISAFIVPPNAGYSEYIDWSTIAQLFSLMAVMKGFQHAGLFSFLANKLLNRADTSKKLMAVLVFLPFFLSMLVTNDVALITFVPFGIIVFRAAGLERYIIPLVVLQTVAANLGSMLTPIGNPQNLYLFNRSGMGFFELILTMLPYVALSAVGLAIVVACFKSVPAQGAKVECKLGGAFSLTWPSVFFVVCILGLFDIVPPVITALAMLAFLVVADRQSLKKVDYSLLVTFIALFVFIGNMGNIEPFRNFLSSVIAGNEELVAVLACQVLSNVPAALLLSGFSSNWQALLVGCNLGGLGTLIASMASLISYKQIAREYPSKRGRYIAVFTAYNVCFLAVLLGESVIIALIA